MTAESNSQSNSKFEPAIWRHTEKGEDPGNEVVELQLQLQLQLQLEFQLELQLELQLKLAENYVCFIYVPLKLP